MCSGESYLCFRKVILQTVGKGVGAVCDRNQMTIERDNCFFLYVKLTAGLEGWRGRETDSAFKNGNE